MRFTVNVCHGMPLCSRRLCHAYRNHPLSQRGKWEYLDVYHGMPNAASHPLVMVYRVCSKVVLMLDLFHLQSETTEPPRCSRCAVCMMSHARNYHVCDGVSSVFQCPRVVSCAQVCTCLCACLSVFHGVVGREKEEREGEKKRGRREKTCHKMHRLFPCPLSLAI